MKIIKNGCTIITDMETYVRHYKRGGYTIVEEDKVDLDGMSYKELQALYTLKTGKKAVGVKKDVILDELNGVV